MEKNTRYSKRLNYESPEYGIYSNQCLICLDSKHVDLFQLNPNCQHRMCFICLDKWINISHNCPVCNQSLVNHNLYDNNNDNDNDDDKIFVPIFSPVKQIALLFALLFNAVNTFTWGRDDNIFFNGDLYDDDDDDDDVDMILFNNVVHRMDNVF